MTHAAVRAEFRAAVQLVLVPLGFAWFESLNHAERTANLPKRWYTLEFLSGDDQRASLGVPTLMRETGSCVVQIYTEQQITDVAATSAADQVREVFTNWRTAFGLRVLECSPPSDLDGGDFRGSFYGVGVDVRYQFDRFVGASPLVTTSRASP